MADSALTSRNSGTQNQIDKNRLVKALQLCKNRSYNFDFAWGNEISGIETLMKSLHVEGIGNVMIPIAKKVHTLVVNKLHILYNNAIICVIQYLFFRLLKN